MQSVLELQTCDMQSVLELRTYDMQSVLQLWTCYNESRHVWRAKDKSTQQEWWGGIRFGMASEQRCSLAYCFDLKEIELQRVPISI